MSWFWMALCAAILWGLCYTLNEITLKYFNPLEIMLFESIVIAITFAVYFILEGDFGDFVVKFSSPKPLGLISLSTLAYIVATILIFKSISSSNASLAAIIESSYPIFTVLFAFIILGKLQLNTASAIGLFLIISGVVIVKLYGKVG